MNLPLVTFQYCDLKVFRVEYLKASRDFQKISTRARKNIIHAFFTSCASRRDLSK